MAEEKKQDPRTVQLKMVRLSFTDGLKDKKSIPGVKDSKERHSSNIIIVKTADPADPLSAKAAALFEENQAKIFAAMRAAGDQQWGKPEAYKDISEDNPKRVAFRKGERFKNDEGEVYAGYAGNYGISASGPGGGQKRPKMYDRHKREVEEKDILDVNYSGSYADLIVSFYGTDEGSRGIFCSIEAIRSRQEGPRIGGGGWTGSVDEFDDLDDGDAFAGTASGGDDSFG